LKQKPHISSPETPEEQVSQVPHPLMLVARVMNKARRAGQTHQPRRAKAECSSFKILASSAFQPCLPQPQGNIRPSLKNVQVSESQIHIRIRSIISFCINSFRPVRFPPPLSHPSVSNADPLPAVPCSHGRVPAAQKPAQDPLAQVQIRAYLLCQWLAQVFS